MDYFWGYVNPKIPDYLWEACFLILCVVMVLTYIVERKAQTFKIVLFFTLIFEYLLLLLCSTVILRSVNEEINYRLTPFWSYAAVLHGREDLIIENFLNVMVFIPLGLMLSTFDTFKRWKIVFWCGFCLSVTIELSQLIFKKGLCELDDMFHNTLGAMIGYWLVLLLLKLQKNIL